MTTLVPIQETLSDLPMFLLGVVKGYYERDKSMITKKGGVI